DSFRDAITLPDPEDRKYPCSYCDKAFTTRAHLARHSLNHTGIRRHKCDVPGCSASFFRSDAMHQHRRSHRRRYEEELRQQSLSSSVLASTAGLGGSSVLLHAAEIIQFGTTQQVQIPTITVAPPPPASPTSAHHSRKPMLRINTFMNDQHIPSPNVSPASDYSTSRPLLLQQNNSLPTLLPPHLDPKVQAWLQEQARKRKPNTVFYPKSPIGVVAKDSFTSSSSILDSQQQPRRTSISFLID
ncbi:hypothetical protein BDR26DRAFT_868826, partial [Obelidium mucronatum]